MAAVAVVLALVAVGLNFVVSGQAGPAGRDGTNGINGTNGSDGQNGMDGTNGTNGLPGTNFTISTTLLPGQSESGLFAVYGTNASALMSEIVNFRIPLSERLGAGNATLNPPSTHTSACPGTGQAVRGWLCVYEVSVYAAAQPIFSSSYFYDPSTGGSGVPVWGFGISFLPAASTSWSYGTWTVTDS